jgi:rare lipoprotein A
LGGNALLKYSGLAWLALLSVAACQAPPTQVVQAPASIPEAPKDPAKAVLDTGTASYYGKAHQGKRTASGDRFDMEKLTAAHPWLPFGTRVRVTLAETGRSVVVTITDRIPSRTRILDLSVAAARQLGMIRQGLAEVVLTPA